MQNRNQVYIIGGSKTESDSIKENLNQKAKKESIRINISHLPADIEGKSFPRQTNNAIIFTPDSIEKNNI